MKNSNQMFFTALYIFFALMLLRSIYKTFFMKLQTPQDYVKKANYAVGFFKARNYANKVLYEALDRFDTMSEEERSFIHFHIGLNLYQKRKNEEAVKHFDLAWPYLKKAKIPYNRIYAALVAANYNIGKKDKAREIYHHLISKEKYDPRFSSLQYLEKSIFK